jgi:hypothetical protein
MSSGHEISSVVLAFDHKHTLAIEPQLRKLQAPTLIVWGHGRCLFSGGVGAVAGRSDPGR